MNKMEKDILSFISGQNEDVNKENANKDSKIVSSHRDLIAGIVSKDIANQKIPKHIMDAHNSGYIHFHDLDYYVSPSLLNCCLVNYPDMLSNGFKMGNAKIGEPQSIGVACTVLSQIQLAVAGAQYGGQTAADLDIHLEKYIQKSYDKLLIKQQKYNLPDSFVEEEIEKEVYDACQTLLFQTNTMTSANG